MFIPFITTLFLANAVCTCLVYVSTSVKLKCTKNLLKIAKNEPILQEYAYPDSQSHWDLGAESLLLSLVGYKLISFESFLLARTYD